MSMSSMIEVAIGLIFVYVLMSLVCSSISEIFASIMKLRSKTLKKGLERLLTDKKTLDEFYAHPLVKSLCKQSSASEKVTASYIPSRIFAAALFDIVVSKDSKYDAKDPAKLREAIAGLKSVNKDLSKALLALFDSAKDDLDKAKKNVEDWFDDAMERVTGWYKKKSQWMLLGLSFITVSIINVDTIDLTQRLWQNPALRQQIAQAADQYVSKAKSKAGQAKPEDIQAAVKDLNTRLDDLEKLSFPIGWAHVKFTKGTDFFWKMIGLFLTTLAVSLGAPFWFDLLNKITRLRVSGEIPKKAAAAKK